MSQADMEDAAHGVYEYKQLENEVIKYICQKIVAMREQPFIDAVENLKKAQELNNLQMIIDMQKNKHKLNQNLEKNTPLVGLNQTHQGDRSYKHML